MGNRGWGDERRRTNYAKNVQLVYIHTRRGCRYNSPLTLAARAALFVECNKGGKKDIRGHLGRDHPAPSLHLHSTAAPLTRNLPPPLFRYLYIYIYITCRESTAIAQFQRFSALFTAATPVLHPLPYKHYISPSTPAAPSFLSLTLDLLCVPLNKKPIEYIASMCVRVCMCDLIAAIPLSPTRRHRTRMRLSVVCA